MIEHRTISSLQTIGLYIPCQLLFHDKNSVGVKVTDRLLKHRHQKKHARKSYVILKRHIQFEDQLFNSKTNEAMPSNLLLN